MEEKKRQQKIPTVKDLNYMYVYLLLVLNPQRSKQYVSKFISGTFIDYLNF